MGAKHYSPEDRERGLTALVLASSSFEAEKVAKIPAGTLRDWKHEHAEQYARLQKDLEPQIVDKIAAEAEGIVLELADIQRGYAQRMRDTMDELKPGEIPGAMRNAATAAALNIDKLSSPLRERPSHVAQDSGVEQLTHQIARLLGKPIPVMNQAEPEYTEASVVPLPSARGNVNAQDQLAGPD